MSSTPHPALAVLLASLACLSPIASAQSPVQQERVAASFVLALGRLPSAVEAEQWARPDNVTLSDLMAKHRQQLQADPSSERAAIDRASRDAFGDAAAAPGLATPAAGTTYLEAMQRRLAWLADHRADYVQVVQRAYRRVLERDAYDIEIDYWTRQPVTSFVLLLGCIEDWARRNQPGLTATSGVASVSVNSRYLAVARLSPAVAAEAGVITGAMRANAALAVAPPAVAAAGGARIASVGGIPFAAAGGTEPR